MFVVKDKMRLWVPTGSKLVLTAVQEPPDTGERNTLPLTPPTTPKVPAKRNWPCTARARTFRSPAKPSLTAVQVVPLSVERNTPAPLVPAKRFEPLTASEVTFTPGTVKSVLIH